MVIVMTSMVVIIRVNLAIMVMAMVISRTVYNINSYTDITRRANFMIIVILVVIIMIKPKQVITILALVIVVILEWKKKY